MRHCHSHTPLLIMLRCPCLCLWLCLSLSSCCQRCVATCSHQPVASGLITSCPISRANPLSVKQPLATHPPSCLLVTTAAADWERERDRARYIDTAIIDGSDIFIIITSPAPRPFPSPAPHPLHTQQLLHINLWQTAGFRCVSLIPPRPGPHLLLLHLLLLSSVDWAKLLVAA